MDKCLSIGYSMDFFSQKFFECLEENSSVSSALALVLVPQQVQLNPTNTQFSICPCGSSHKNLILAHFHLFMLML